jgi:hypothetical protein
LGQIGVAMPRVALKVIAVVLEHIVVLIFDLPARTACGYDRSHGVVSQAVVGGKGVVVELFARRHQKLVYGLLFRASAAAAQELAQDPRFVGGTLGMVGVLHTWTRALIYHPHIHYVVPGGGLSADGRAWHAARENFLLPVRALSVLFRAKFRDALRQTELVAEVPPEVWTQDWVVHCQSVGNGAAALKYLAPYIFRVAISNRRILSLEDDQVTFGYTDSRSGQRKTCTVSAEEFIRRSLQHMPQGFSKARYYGFLGPGQREVLTRVRQLLP